MIKGAILIFPSAIIRAKSAWRLGCSWVVKTFFVTNAATPQEFLELAADFYAQGTGTFLGLYAGQDKKDENVVALQMSLRLLHQL